MTKLTESISATKEAQRVDYASLPRADPYQERTPYAECRSLSKVLKTLSEKEPEYTSLPPVTLLRCAIADLSKGKAEGDPNPTAEEILRMLEGRIPWLLTEEGYTFKVSTLPVLCLVQAADALSEIHIRHSDSMSPFRGGNLSLFRPRPRWDTTSFNLEVRQTPTFRAFPYRQESRPTIVLHARQVERRPHQSLHPCHRNPVRVHWLYQQPGVCPVPRDGQRVWHEYEFKPGRGTVEAGD